MTLTIAISMNSAAFESGHGREAARILSELAGQVAGAGLGTEESWPVYDINGNQVGEARVYSDAEAEAFCETAVKLIVAKGGL